MATRDIAASGAGVGLSRPSLEATSPRYGEKAIKALLALCAGLSVAITTGIVVSLLLPTLEFVREVSIGEFLTGTLWAPAFATPSFGVLPIVVGTLMVVFFSLIVAIPIGLASAVYLSEYAPQRARKVIKPVLEVLAGIPTVAIGLFALAFLRPLAERLFPLMIVPLVASISEDAMRAVPNGLREGAHALGANKLKVSLRVVFPAAISGIVASIVLAASRAVGETMVVLIAAGAGNPKLSFDPTKGVQTMTSYIGGTATGDIATGTIQYQTIFAVGTLLFLMTLVMNLIAIRLVRRFREEYE
jgi:phosphate transport system permease protein